SCSCGLTARLSRRCMTEVSRQLERRRWPRELLAWLGGEVDPGGKALADEHALLDQTGRQPLALQPCHGALRIGLAQVAQLQQRLQALEGQLDLPASSVQLHQR